MIAWLSAPVLFAPLLFVAPLTFSSPLEPTAPQLELISTGKTSLYSYNKKDLQDLSAAAYHNGKIIFGFDGGKNAAYPEVRSINVGDMEGAAYKLKREIVQRDIEGGTYVDGKFVFTSSLSKAKTNEAEYSILAAFKLDKNKSAVNEQYLYARKKVLDALVSHFNDDEWSKRMRSADGKLGGLNVEALSSSHKGDDHLVMGLRSPLWYSHFGNPDLGNKLNLKTGNAILLEWYRPFDLEQRLKPITLDLNNQGIRGMEYIPALKGYVIISGPVEKARDFNLWFYDPVLNKTQKLKIDDSVFNGLCRPESILHIPEKFKIFVLSEESGKACADSKFTYIEYRYQP